MAQALEQHQQAQEIKQKERNESEKMVVAMKKVKEKLKKRKWVDWQTDRNAAEQTQAAAAAASKRASTDEPFERVKRKKCAILLSYCGSNYFGMQRNPGMATIEEELFKAMLKNKWITQESYDAPQQAAFQRAARTDKGVSAARQVCSIKLPDAVDVAALNADLPEQIRLFAVQRVTKGFNAKDKCNARTYSYTLPSIAFTDWKGALPDYASFRLSAEQKEQLQQVLRNYEGTKNFHNFTSRKNFHDPSVKRFIMSFTASEPFLSTQGIEFITLKVKGQSFMLHQIRKMVGLAIAIVRQNTSIDTMERAFLEERMDLPMAPGLGLVLNHVHYERYNERYGKDGIHEALTWQQHDADIEQFVEKYINASIYEIEFKDKPMLEWAETLSLHSYAPRAEEEQQQTTAAAKDDEDE